MAKVLVTGASGFIAKHIVRELLDQGHEVRGSVRSERRRRELDALFGPGAVEYVTLDLTADDGWASALAGVDVLLHTASPFPTAEPQHRDELIRPAVDGTLRALRAAHDNGVGRVILTSSCAAVYKDASKPRHEVSTEANWTDPDGPDTSAYEASKTLAERAAWDFAAQHPELRLTSINPGGVFGPAMDANYGTSLEIIEQVLGRAFPLYPNINMPAVDVRDVARMHVAAIDNVASIGRRFPANAGALTMLQVAQILAEAYPSRRIPTRRAPDLLIRLGARVNPTLRLVVGNLGRNNDVDGSAAEQVFGFRYIPSTDAVLASAESILGLARGAAAEARRS